MLSGWLRTRNVMMVLIALLSFISAAETARAETETLELMKKAFESSSAMPAELRHAVPRELIVVSAKSGSLPSGQDIVGAQYIIVFGRKTDEGLFDHSIQAMTMLRSTGGMTPSAFIDKMISGKNTEFLSCGTGSSYLMVGDKGATISVIAAAGTKVLMALVTESYHAKFRHGEAVLRRIATTLCGMLAIEGPKPELGEVDILDANPQNSFDQKSFVENWNVKQLIAAKTSRKGVATDGVSQLLLRVEVSRDVPVLFRLGKTSDGKIEPLLSGKTISVKGKDKKEKKRYFAFTLYSPPDTFDVGKAENDILKSPVKPPAETLGDHLEKRDIVFFMRAEGGVGKYGELVLVRPPVVLVHGLFSDPIQTWVKTHENGSSMAALLERAGFLPFMVNYQDSNGTEKIEAKPNGEASSSWLTGKPGKHSSSYLDNKRVV